MFDIFKKKKDPENIDELLLQFKQIKKDFRKLSKDLKEIKRQNRFSVQKIGIVRFNPFKDLGGNQSFSAALLDAKNDGIVITSLYGNDGNRVFGKPVKRGKSQYSLTKEEKRAVEKAINSNVNSQDKKNKNDKKNK